jgi:hypothetical protein
LHDFYLFLTAALSFVPNFSHVFVEFLLIMRMAGVLFLSQKTDI